MKFTDGLKSLMNGLINRRNPQSTNTVVSTQILPTEAYNIYKTGIGSKIVRIKTSYSLKNTIDFANKDDEIFFNTYLKKKIRDAARWMMVFGRGVIVIHERNADLEKLLIMDDLKKLDMSNIQLHVFSGDMVTIPAIERTLGKAYFKPKMYAVRGYQIHPSRVIDFTYIKPTEDEAPAYQYGGISEFELIRPQIINDGIIERSSAFIVERNSTLFYKYKGFKAALETGNEKSLLEFFRTVEDARSIYGAGILDVEDDVTSVDQTLTNLADVDTISLRRLALVSGIPLAVLVGENVKGLNSTGENEKLAFQEMIESFEDEFLYEPINELMFKMGRGKISFKENQGGTQNERADYESKIIANASSLQVLGEDYEQYLLDKGIVKNDPIEDFFKIEEEVEDNIEENYEEGLDA